MHFADPERRRALAHRSRGRAVVLLAFAILAAAAAGALPAAGALVDRASAHYRYDHGFALNDLVVTPGATFAVARGAICTPGYSSAVREVSESLKLAVYREYAVTHHTSGQYEIDHLISLELGGDNAIANLWPEPNDHPPGYLNSKDILENALHARVCSGRLSLASAQHQIATDWVTAFHRYLGRWPGGVLATTTTAPPGVGTDRVAIVSIAAVVPRGGRASVVARASAGARCTLEVTLPSGRVSTAIGLGAASADAKGVVAWSWSIAASTDPGSAQVVLDCAGIQQRRSFEIT